ncbi:MAG: type IX secretion system membrane protein PorP/SprF, partial [Bacteroidales bacterium]|nr:type IX secretion system membrane protein PorP/SprF [Bacteroidales bacterium]
ASYRTTEQVLVGLLQANINPQLSVILSYDVPTGRMNTYSKGSTEIAIRYEFGSKASTADPRYF